MSIAYGRPPRQIEEVLKLIAKAATGRKLLESFMPLMTRGKVVIESYPEALVSKLREVIPTGQPIGACFIVDPKTALGRIYLDFESPLGVLAPFLVHEIVHALDARIWQGHTRRKAALHAAEGSAFQSQFLFTQELRERDPEYDRFLRTTFPRAKILNELLEPEDIEALYSGEGEEAA
jgi:hypothetical protein